MFDLPQAKRVRRNELQSPESSRESSPDAAAVERLRAHQFDYVVAEAPTSVSGHAVRSQESAEAEDEVEFNLFAKKQDNGRKQTTVVQLRSPSPTGSQDGFQQSQRPGTYYFTNELSETLRKQYERAAVSGDHVREFSQLYCPGSYYPWKVTVWPPTSLVKHTTQSLQGADAPPRRTRMGKKARIKKRKQLGLREAQAKAVGEEKQAKERADREKKARRNREKKFKKRARDKNKKLSAAEEQPEGPDVESEVSDSGGG